MTENSKLGERICSPLKLPSNAVCLRTGGDGNEPKDICKRWEEAALKGRSRFTIAVNSYYPELSGAYYYNRAVIGLLEKAIHQAGLSLIQNELFSNSNPLPDELEGALVPDEDYQVTSNDRVVGSLLLWQMAAGGEGAYYDDAIILDFKLAPALGLRLFETVTAECKASGIAVTLTA